MAAPFTILLVGGYGFFGSLLGELIARDGRAALVISGRNAPAAEREAARLRAFTSMPVRALAGDARSAPDALIAAARADIVASAAGPFQELGYGLPAAAIRAGLPYLDIADARGFVAGIGELDAAARQAGVAVIAGASSLPGLSSAVIAELASDLTAIETVDIALTPASREPRGIATARAGLSYCGKTYQGWDHGGPVPVTGWRDLRRVEYPGFGQRLVAPCDIADLAVLPRRYPDLQRVSFRAGVDFAWMNALLVGLGWLVRAGLLGNAANLARPLVWINDRLRHFYSDVGAMRIDVAGRDAAGAPVRRDWTITSHHGDGPKVPVLPAWVLLKRYLEGARPAPGARACVEEFTLDEFTMAAAPFALEQRRGTSSAPPSAGPAP